MRKKQISVGTLGKVILIGAAVVGVAAIVGAIAANANKTTYSADEEEIFDIIPPEDVGRPTP